MTAGGKAEGLIPNQCSSLEICQLRPAAGQEGIQLKCPVAGTLVDGRAFALADMLAKRLDPLDGVAQKSDGGHRIDDCKASLSRGVPGADHQSPQDRRRQLFIAPGVRCRVTGKGKPLTEQVGPQMENEQTLVEGRARGFGNVQEANSLIQALAPTKITYFVHTLRN